MLPKNILRINGYDDKDKRTHIDIEVTMYPVQGRNIYAPKIPHPDDIWELGHSRGLMAVTSFNYWNYVADKRLTERMW